MTQRIQITLTEEQSEEIRNALELYHGSKGQVTIEEVRAMMVQHLAGLKPAKWITNKAVERFRAAGAPLHLDLEADQPTEVDASAIREAGK